MPKLRDIMTPAELEQMDLIQKEIDQSLTPNRVAELDEQMERIIDHAKERYNKLNIPNPLLVEHVLNKNEQEYLQIFLRNVGQEADFLEVKKMTETLLEVLHASEKRYFQELIQTIE